MKPLLALLLLSACATARAPIDARSFRRAELDQVRLERIDLVVVSSGPPRVADERFAVAGFEPPAIDAPLEVGPVDAPTSAALASSFERRLRDAGFEVKLHVSTSSSVSSSLGARLDGSGADALLVVRAVPVDRWFVDVGRGVQTIDTPFGRERVRDSRPEPREGRLLVGQAFLYDRASRVRLWSKQAPEYPDQGRLTPGHPFLGYGHEGADPVEARAAGAAEAFAERVLADFPRPSRGQLGAAEALLALDSDAERRAQAFADQSWVLLEVEGGWGLETSELALAFFDRELPALPSAAISPHGFGRVGPRVGLLGTNGWRWSLGASWARSPSSFARTYWEDNPRPSAMEPRDRATQLRIDGASVFGASASGGPTLRLAGDWRLVPHGGAFVDVWTVDATPAVSVPDRTRIRLGAAVGLDLYRWLGERPWGFLRVGVEGRAGVDLAGGPALGGGASLGAGLLL